MSRLVLVYGALLALLVVLMRVAEYGYFVRRLSFEFYVGLVALLFTGLGGWLGWKVAARRKVAKQTAAPNPEIAGRLGISSRELEVLQLLSQGLSNQEIADKLFLSLNTVKTHTSTLFGKLGAARRTQAVQKARELGMLG